MDQNSKNTYIAVGLSLIVIILWQVLYVTPKLREEEERQRLEQQQAQVEQAQQPGRPGATAPSGTTAGAPQPATGATGVPQPTAGAVAPTPSLGLGVERDAVLTKAPRVLIETPSLKGSISLRGGRIDDLILTKHQVTADETSDNVTLLSPAGSAAPFYAEYGWSKLANDTTNLPTASTVWTLESGEKLTETSPVTLSWDNGSGLTFRKIISLDEHYMFTVRREIINAGSGSATLYPYGLISRHGTPRTEGIWVLHEGLIGVLGEEGLQEIDYSDLQGGPAQTFSNTQR
ncbi:MAG: membrane protein insertase YidC, partial [Pseudomonadota bacterium]